MSLLAVVQWAGIAAVSLALLLMPLVIRDALRAQRPGRHRRSA